MTTSVISSRRKVNNLLRNGDFEVAPIFTAVQTTRSKWIDGTAAGSATVDQYRWALGGPADATSARFDPTVTHSGSYSLKLSNTDTLGRARALHLNANNYSTVTSIQARTYCIPVLGGTSYTLSAWVKTNNCVANGAKIGIVELDSTFGPAVSSGSTGLTGTNDWTYQSLTVTTAASTLFVGIQLLNDVAGNVSDVWFDDVRFDLTTGTSRLTAGTRLTA